MPATVASASAPSIWAASTAATSRRGADRRRGPRTRAQARCAQSALRPREPGHRVGPVVALSFRRMFLTWYLTVLADRERVGNGKVAPREQPQYLQLARVSASTSSPGAGDRAAQPADARRSPRAGSAAPPPSARLSRAPRGGAPACVAGRPHSNTPDPRVLRDDLPVERVERAAPDARVRVQQPDRLGAGVHAHTPLRPPPSRRAITPRARRRPPASRGGGPARTPSAGTRARSACLTLGERIVGAPPASVQPDRERAHSSVEHFADHNGGFPTGAVPSAAARARIPSVPGSWRACDTLSRPVRRRRAGRHRRRLRSEPARPTWSRRHAPQELLRGGPLRRLDRALRQPVAGQHISPDGTDPVCPARAL